MIVEACSFYCEFCENEDLVIGKLKSFPVQVVRLDAGQAVAEGRVRYLCAYIHVLNRVERSEA
jgi:hypothetical protein